jgi:hypothetical protein
MMGKLKPETPINLMVKKTPFPVDFPLNQSIDHRRDNIHPAPKSSSHPQASAGVKVSAVRRIAADAPEGCHGVESKLGTCIHNIYIHI